MYFRLALANSVNTVDKEAEQRLNRFLDTIFPPAMAAEQKLKEKLLASKLEPEGFAIPLRNMRAEADLFREANLPLLAEQQKLSLEYDKIFGAQTVEWEGKEVTLTKLKTVFEEPERSKREKAWRLIAERQLADRKAVNELWQKFMTLRANIAANAGKPSFREYAWQQKLRFDYTPEDCKSFQKAILEVAVPAASRIYARRRKALGVDRLRPWDLTDGWYSRPPEPPGLPVLKPFEDIDTLNRKTSAIFHKVDPQLGEYYDIMLEEGLTDLEKPQEQGSWRVLHLVHLPAPAIHLCQFGRHPRRRDDRPPRIRSRLPHLRDGQSQVHPAAFRADGIRRGSLDGHGTAGLTLPDQEGRRLLHPGRICPRPPRTPGA